MPSDHDELTDAPCTLLDLPCAILSEIATLVSEHDPEVGSDSDLLFLSHVCKAMHDAVLSAVREYDGVDTSSHLEMQRITSVDNMSWSRLSHARFSVHHWSAARIRAALGLVAAEVPGSSRLRRSINKTNTGGSLLCILRLVLRAMDTPSTDRRYETLLQLGAEVSHVGLLAHAHASLAAPTWSLDLWYMACEGAVREDCERGLEWALRQFGHSEDEAAEGVVLHTLVVKTGDAYGATRSSVTEPLPVVPLRLLRWALAAGFRWPPFDRGLGAFLVCQMLLSAHFEMIYWMVAHGLEVDFGGDYHVEFGWNGCPVSHAHPEYEPMLRWLVARGFAPDDPHDRQLIHVHEDCASPSDGTDKRQESAGVRL